MNILHTESSKGWGGQEIRILREAEGMRQRGHEVTLAVAAGGGLVSKARQKGFTVYELAMDRRYALKTLLQLQRIIRDKSIDIINTHSSWDSWIAGIAARMCKRKVVRTRHLSTRIKPGLNSRLLYKGLADYVVTTSSCIIPSIISQSKIEKEKVKCIATGVDPSLITVENDDVQKFRQMFVKPGDVLVGTVCFVRSWKGIVDLLKAAKIVKQTHPHIKWVVVGGGYYKEYLGYLDAFDIKDVVTFTGHLDSPYTAIQGLDVFMLLSTAHEGISQASLQAAYLEKPLITTDVGGLPEVCIHGTTGFVVPPFSAQKVADAVIELALDPQLREKMGQKAKELVLSKYTLTHTLNDMEEVYKSLFSNARRALV